MGSQSDIQLGRRRLHRLGSRGMPRRLVRRSFNEDGSAATVLFFLLNYQTHKIIGVPPSTYCQLCKEFIDNEGKKDYIVAY